MIALLTSEYYKLLICHKIFYIDFMIQWFIQTPKHQQIILTWQNWCYACDNPAIEFSLRVRVLLFPSIWIVLAYFDEIYTYLKMPRDFLFILLERWCQVYKHYYKSICYNMYFVYYFGNTLHICLSTQKAPVCESSLSSACH